jgi:hypothetical protein
MTLFYKATLVAVYLSLYTSTAFTAPKQKTIIAYNSPLFMAVKEKVDEKVSTTTIKEAVQPLEEAINGEEVNGSHDRSNNSNLNSAIDLINGNTTNLNIDVVGLVEEINDQIIAGSNELFNNMTNIIEKQLSLVPEDSVANYDISQVLSDVTKDIQNAQKKEFRDSWMKWSVYWFDHWRILLLMMQLFLLRRSRKQQKCQTSLKKRKVER